MTAYPVKNSGVNHFNSKKDCKYFIRDFNNVLLF